MVKKWIQGAVHPSRVGAYKKHAKTLGGMSKAIKHDLGAHSKASLRTKREAAFAKAMQTIRNKHKH
jgi:hypothetical protein